MANEILSYEEVLALLSQQARDGSVTGSRGARAGLAGSGRRAG